MFINDLPNGKDTRGFYTEDASGSTSQAANVIESMEAGASVMLIDEDTSATNFMIRDELMQRVIHRDMEPITPFIGAGQCIRILCEICGKTFIPGKRYHTKCSG
ncbi:Predicted ATPase of the ABC class [Dorea longicatena]|nr:Predicted ATPase of the ABC class [Dorea longicatena]